MSSGGIEVERLAPEALPQHGWACGVTQAHARVPSFVASPPPAHRPAFSLAWVLPLSSIGLVTGKFQLKVAEPVAVHPLWRLWGAKGRRVSMYRPALDSCVRDQQPLSTQGHRHIHLSQRWAASQSLSIHRDQHFLGCML